MFTICPKCTLTLGVTAGDLRVGQGYVRCGRCLNVFNALLTLSDEPEVHVEVQHQVDPASASQIMAALNASHGAQVAEAASEPRDEPAPGSTNVSRADGPALHLPLEQSSDGGIESASSMADGTGTFETIILEGDAITSTEEFVPEESVDSEIASLTRRLDNAANEPIATPLPAAADLSEPPDPNLTQTYWVDTAPMRDAEEDGLAQARQELLDTHDAVGELDAANTDAADEQAEEFADAEAQTFQVESAESESAPAQRWAWAVAVLLLVLLAAQAANHWRDTLARLPGLSAPLLGLYAALGVPLDPHWQLSAYDVRQEGADADHIDPQIIRVRLSLANHAARAQPAPLLRLTLLDHFGKPVAARDLTPAEYWPHGAAAHALLAHEERIDSEVAVRDPSASASFELDVCLRDAAGVVRCAADQSAPGSALTSRNAP